ncbi:MAG: ABC transporter ATP-binding protein [Bacillaceae bacterium]|nr:ABC transporter ATP-binding protein [Bacillaceae bacterium]
MTSIETKNLTVSYDEKVILSELNVTIPKNKITVLVGSNGCGKSTLLRTVSRLLKPKEGTIFLDQKEIHRMQPKKLAQHLAILPQSSIAPEGLTVFQLVKQGRYPYQNWLSSWSKKDERIVEQALTVTGLNDFKDMPVDALSGGQRQRAWIALVLAQNTEYILLDEPTTYLDLSHQIEILDLLYDLNEQEERTIVMVLHDINLACRYAHHIIALKSGSIYAEGKPEDIITEQLLNEVFDLECQITEDPIYGTPLCLPLGKGRKINSKVKIGV